jgi:hypothetical protein
MIRIPLWARVSLTEQAAIRAAVAQIVAGLFGSSSLAGQEPPVFVDDTSALVDSPAGTLRVISLLPELTHLDEPWAAQEARLRADMEALAACGDPVFIMTILRDAGQEEDRDLLYRRRVRIRRLNLLAAELSQQTGAFVADIDRVLADIGGHVLQTDYRMSGEAAVEMAGHVIALCIIANGLDAFVSAEAQEKARELVLRSMPRFDTVPSLVPTDVMTFGRGRRAQTVAATIDLEGRAQALKLVRQTISRDVAFSDALDKLIQVIRRRGMVQSGQLIVSAMLEMAKAGWR